MDLFSEQRPCRVGDEVFGSDEHKIGTVAAVQADYITVEKGLLFKHDLYIPTSAINSCENGRVYLNVPKDAVETQGWDVPPLTETEADGRPLIT